MNPLPPWALSHLELNTKWVKAITIAQADLCTTLAMDCAEKVRTHENSIQALMIDLQGVIDAVEFDEIKVELNYGYTQAVDKQHAEKILARTNANAKLSAKNNRRIKKPVPSTSQKGRNQPSKKARFRQQSGNPSPNLQNGRQPTSQRNGPYKKDPIKAELQRQLLKLTKSLKNLK